MRAAVFAQAGQDGVPWDQLKFLALLGGVLILMAALAGVHIVSNAKRQSTSDAISIGTRVAIGAIVFASATVIIGIAKVLITWSNLAPPPGT